MEQHVLSAPKINLTLRVGPRKADGYHDLASLFLRLPPIETLTIRTRSEDNVKDHVEVHSIVVEGENLLFRAAEGLRSMGWPLPGLDLSLWKKIPPGTGFGAGSGNAAAFLRWASLLMGRSVPPAFVRRLGADIPFLLSGLSLAFVEGEGECFEALSPLEGIVIVLIVPSWSSSTGTAFARLDERRAREGLIPNHPLSWKDEADQVLQALRAGRSVGLLPNDFSEELFEDHPQYLDLFGVAAQAQALAWGISGSGSGAFVLFRKVDDEHVSPFMAALSTLSWINHLFVLE